MKFRLKVKINSKKWKTGIILHNTYLDAQIRQEELRLIGITAKITDQNGSEIF